MSLPPDRVKKLGLAWHHLRTMAQRGVSGTLELDTLGAGSTLAIADGAICLAPDHPLARHLAGGGAAGVSEAARQLAQTLHDRPARAARFVPAHGSPSQRGLAAIPVGKVLRWGAKLQIESPDWLERLLPNLGDLLTAATKIPMADQVGGWEPEELWLLERLRQPMPAASVLAESPVPARKIRAALAGLLLSGYVRPSEAPEPASAAVDIGSLASKLGDRIAASLEDRPLGLSAAEYRQKIADLVASAGGLDHYELLGVHPGVDSEEVAHAFEELGRLAHPSNAARFGLEAGRAALTYLFERACEAYRTLADPDLRLRYHSRFQIAMPVEQVSRAERDRESRELARRNFQRAREEEAAGDFHTALQLLEQVVRTAPRSEYWMALARLQKRNPAWSRRAVESYRAALELDPQSGVIRFELGELHEQMGELDRARVLYQSAAASTPPHPGARAALARLSGDEGGASLLDRLLGRS